MLPVSAKWAPALTTDHGLSTKINVLYGGSIVAEDIDFVDGSVKVDRGSDVRRSLSLTIADPSAFPTLPTDRFSVYGQRIYVETGLRYMDGSTERVPVGTFVITSVSGDIHTGPLSIQASGLEILVKRYLWDSAVSTTTSLSAAQFISSRLAAIDPALDFVDASTLGTMALATKTWDANSDAWTTFREVAESLGCELFCDANGTFRLVDIPDPASSSLAPVWDVTTGEHGVMVSAEKELSATDVYNKIIVTGENVSDNAPAVRGVATISDPADPLRYGGPFGQVAKHVSSSLVTTSAQATGMAASLLAKYRSANRTVSLETVPNAALDAGDCIRADYGPAAPPELHLVQSFELPLGVSNGAFSIETIGGREVGD